MDYTIQRLGFKIKKALRYVRLYGAQRTFVKIKGQYHMKKRYESLPALPNPPRHGGCVGLIGCGNYAFSNIAYYLKNHCRGILRGAMDLDLGRAASLFESHELKYYTDDAREIIRDPDISLVYIASNHASHAEYAIDCIKAGKHVHIEKPHVIDQNQLERLTSAMERNPEVKVFLGFNRPRSPLFKKLQLFLTKESGPLMINWFVSGHEIPEDHWYFDEKEGGRVLGNLCHWTDLTLHLVSFEKAFPCAIISATPVGAKSDFVVSVIFADRSCASITFSAKGHTFEGVREILNIHKGNVLANLTDFQSLSVDVIDKQYKIKTLYRDHGHEINIINSYKAASSDCLPGEPITYVRATAMFFLAVKKAIDTGEKVVLSREETLGR